MEAFEKELWSHEKGLVVSPWVMSCGDEARLVQALRLRLRKLQEELQEARALCGAARAQAEERRSQQELLAGLRRRQVAEARQLERQRLLELRDSAGSSSNMHALSYIYRYISYISK